MVDKKDIIIGITGASGAIYAVELIKYLKSIKHIRMHLVISQAARDIIVYETSLPVSGLVAMADYYYECNDFNAPIASGSFNFYAMTIVPCSMKTLSAISSGYANNLITRAADVALKEKKKLIIVPRETPYNLIHLRNMERVTLAGAVIMPASPGFYHKPADITALVQHFTGRLMCAMDIPNNLVKPWGIDKLIEE